VCEKKISLSGLTVKGGEVKGKKLTGMGRINRIRRD
jgi:hypothetical protein